MRRPSEPAAVRSPVANLGRWPSASSRGNISPPIARMVTPLPPVKQVKKADITIATTATPPGIQPKTPRKSTTRRLGAPPSARM